VRMHIEEQVWEDTKRLFTVFREDLTEGDAVETKRGTILFDSASRGMLYVKGIFVQKREDFRHGYDLKTIELDRDRRIINDYDLKYETALIYKEAMDLKPNVMIKRVYDMVQTGAEDVRGMGIYTSIAGSASEQIAAQFLKDNGEDAVPVKTMKESEELDHNGRKGVVVGDTLSAILKTSKIDTLETLKKKRETEIKTRFSWSDLSLEEQKNLKDAGDMIEAALEWVTEERCKDLFLTNIWVDSKIDVLGNIQIVEFHTDALEGTAELDKQTIKISRLALSHVSRTLRVLIHEKAHLVATYSSSSTHGRFAEELWTLVNASDSF